MKEIKAKKLKEIRIFSGKSHPALAEKVCQQLKIPLSPLRIEEYSNSCSEIILEKDVRDKIVFLIQTSSPDNLFKNIWELLLMIKTVSVFGAKEIIVIMPYISYARSDKKHKKYSDRMIIAGEFLIGLLEEKGMKRFIGVDFHSEKFEKFFSSKTKVYHLSVLPMIAKALKEKSLRNTILLAPDKGARKKTSLLAKELKILFGWVEKKRIDDTNIRIKKIYGEITGKDVIILDDEISAGTTIKALAKELKKLRVRSLTVAVTHGLFVRDALKNFQDIKILKEIIVTDTVPISREIKKSLPLRVLSIDKLLADKIKEIC